MQFPRLAGGGIDAIEIKHAIGRITGRLNFRDDHARAQRMNRTAL